MILIALALFLVLGSARGIADFAIEFLWWSELDQIPTWFSILLYKIGPLIFASLLAWAALLWAHRRGTSFAGADTSAHSLYRRIVPLVLLVLAVVFIGSQVESWVVMAFAGSRGIDLSAGQWADPIFGKSLPFYLFDLPFLSLLVKYLFTLAFMGAVVFWLSVAAGKSSINSAASGRKVAISRNSTSARSRCCSPGPPRRISPRCWHASP